MMNHYQQKYIKDKIEKLLKNNKVDFKEVKVELEAKTYHHQGMSIYVTLPKGPKDHWEKMHIIHFKSPPTGCGTIIMHGHYDAGTPVFKPIVEMLLEHYRADGAGTCIATQGGHEYDNCQRLTDLGFVKVCTFDNLAHPNSDDKQSIFVRSVARDPDDFEENDDWEEDEEEDDDDE